MRRVLLLAVGMFALGLDAYVLTGVLGDLARSLDVSTGTAGQMVTAFTLSYAVLSPVLATLTAAWPRRAVLVGALAVFTVANVASALAPDFGLLVAARVVAGAGAGLFAPTAAAVATSLVPEEQRGRALSASLGGLLAATVLGVPVGTVIGNAFGWRATMALVVVLGAAAAVLVAVGLPEVSTGRPPALRARLATVAEPRVAPLLAVMLVASTATLGLYTYLGTILTSATGVDRGALPAYLLCWGAAGVVGNLLVGRLLDRGRSPLMLLCVVLAVLTAAQLGLGVAGPLSVLAVLAGFGAAGGAAQVPLQHRLVDVAGDRAPVAISLLSSALYLGSALGSGLGARALPLVGAASLGPLAAVLAGASLVLTSVLWWRGRAGDRVRPPVASAAGDRARCG